VFESDYSHAGYGLTATTTIELEPALVRVRYEAVVSEPFLRNRLGLCVLLPATLSGKPLLVRARDGSETRIAFPEQIAPHQPCGSIGELEFTVADHLVRMRFWGDTFEMEDQRNWTDFSYKVYCTPLSDPRPVRLEPGDRVEQCVEISLTPVPASNRTIGAQRAGAAGALEPRVVQCRVPDIGTRLVDGSRTSDLPVDYYRLDSPSLVPFAPPEALAADSRIHLYEWSDEGGAAAFDRPDVACRAHADPTTAAVRPVAESARGVSEAAIQLRGLVGTDGAFVELNRERPTVGEGETVVFTISPQVHDTDDEVVLDNLFGMRAVLESARYLYPDRPIGIGLLELTPHFNPAAGDRAANASLRPVDSRLQEGFALAWAFAALCELSAAGVEFVTIFDDSGTHGIVGQDGLVPAGRLLYEVASRTSVTVTLPPARIGSERRYSMLCDGDGSDGDDSERPTARRQFLAANLGESEWVTSVRSLLARGGAATGGGRWRVRLTTRDAPPGHASEGSDAADTDHHERVVGADDELVLPSVSYLRVVEEV
jgi:D-apionolactonase